MPNCEIEMCEVSSLSGQSESSVLHLPLSVSSLGFKQLRRIHTAIKEDTKQTLYQLITPNNAKVTS